MIESSASHLPTPPPLPDWSPGQWIAYNVDYD